jgi:hypothetical protein
MRLKTQFKAAITATLLMGLCGCASIVSHSKWPVTFNSNPTGAEITVTDYVGNQQKGTTPLKLTLKSGKGFFSAAYYDIEAKMDGYSTAKVRLQADLNGWYWGNFALGGPYGMLFFGLWVDPATGAMWKLPPQYTVNLSKTTADNSEHRKQMISIDSIPKELLSKIVAIK